MAIVNGTTGNDNPLNGTAGDDIINGLAGNDTINGGNGVDIIDGGDGDDTVSGGAGADEIHGGAGADTLNGLSENDVIWGDAGNDTINGGSGDDVIYGGAGNDTIVGGTGLDTVHINADAATSIATWSGTTLIVTTSDGVDRISQSESLVFNNRTFTFSGNNVVASLAADSKSTDEDVNASGNVLTNDINIDGTLAVTTFSHGSTQVAAGGSLAGVHGTLTLGANGAYSYVPASNEQGEDVFTYTVNDGGVIQTQTLTITINNINDAPVANAATASGLEDTDITGTVTASDIDNAPTDLIYTVFAGPSHGNVVLNPNGTFTYTPTGNYFGPDAFTFVATDGPGPGAATSAPQSVSLTITSVNDAPDAEGVSDFVLEDGVLTNTLPGSDVDDDAASLTYSVATGPLHGVLVVQDDGSFTYTPAADFSGYDGFTWTVTDAGGLSSTAGYDITVAPVNDAPVANAGSGSGQEDGTITGFLTGSDVDSPTLAYSATSQPEHGALTVDSQTGAYTYTPDANFVGEDSFTFFVSDGSEVSTQTIILTVNPVNDSPEGAASTNSGDEDTDIVGQVFATDVDNTNAELTYSLGADPEHGTVVFNADGTYTYTPDADFNGADSFSWSVEDPSGEGASGTVNLTISPVNDAPRPEDFSLEGTEDTTVLITIPATDIDGDTQSVTSVGGQAIFTGDTVAVGHGTVTLQLDGNLLFTPDDDFNGPVDFDYVLTESSGVRSRGPVQAVGESVTGHVHIDVTPVNDDPTADARVFSGQEDQQLSGSLAGSGHDIDGDDLTYEVVDGLDGLTLNPDGTFTVSPPANYSGGVGFSYRVNDGHGGFSEPTSVSLFFSPTPDAPVAADSAVTAAEDVLFEGSLPHAADIDGPGQQTFTVLDGPEKGELSLQTDGTYTYLGNPNYNGSDSFSYTVTDQDGLTSTATVTIGIEAVNDAPVAENSTSSATEDQPITGQVSALDIDGDDLTYVLDGNDGNDSLILNPDGSFSYTPGPDFNGTLSFTYHATDGSLSSNTATHTITVDAVNDDPVAGVTSVSGDEDTDISGTIAAPSDIDGDTAFSFEINEDPSNGSVTIGEDGQFTYRPDADFSGEDSFTYSVSDGNGGFTTGTVSVTVQPTNDAPVAVDSAFDVAEDNVLEGAILATDVDADDELTYTLNDSTVSGLLILNADGTFTYTPDENFNGPDSFTYTVEDVSGESSTGVITLNVGPVNDAPVGEDDSEVTLEDNAVFLQVLVNDHDVDVGDELSVTEINGEALTEDGVTVLDGETVLGVVTQTEGGLLFTPAANYNGTATFSYTVSDGSLSSTASVSVIVDAENDAPVAAAGSATMAEDSVLEGAVPEATDVEGDSVTYSVADGPAHGALEFNADGTFSYTPDENFFGEDSFTYFATDADDGAPATFTINVTSVNDDPDSTASNVSTLEDTPINGSVLDNVVDPDTNNVFTFSILTQPEHGALTIDAATGAYTYTPDADFNGTDSFQWSVDDGFEGSSSNQVNITVGAVNDAPAAPDVDQTILEDAAPITIVVPHTDVDGNAVTVVTVGGHAIDAENPISVAGGTVSLNEDGDLVFTPAANFNGPVDFDYTLSDGGVRSDFEADATKYDTVGTVVSEAGATGQQIRISASGSASDLFAFVGNSSFAASHNLDPGFSYGPVINGGGVQFEVVWDFSKGISFDFAIDGQGDGDDIWSIVVVDSDGNYRGLLSNRMSQAGSGSVNTDWFSFNNGLNDGETYTFSIIVANRSNAASGSFTVDNLRQGEDLLVLSEALTDTGHVHLDVTPVNDAPTGAPVTDAGDEDTVITGEADFTDIDHDNLAYSVGQATHGTVTIDEETGVYSFTPDHDYNGTATFTVTGTDAGGLSATSEVTITVNPVNDAPVATNFSDTILEDADPVTIIVPHTDVDGDVVTVASVNGQAIDVLTPVAVNGGTVSLNEDGDLVFTADPDFNGPVDFDYVLSDGQPVIGGSGGQPWGDFDDEADYSAVNVFGSFLHHSGLHVGGVGGEQGSPNDLTTSQFEAMFGLSGVFIDNTYLAAGFNFTINLAAGDVLSITETTNNDEYGDDGRYLIELVDGHIGAVTSLQAGSEGGELTYTADSTGAHTFIVVRIDFNENSSSPTYSGYSHFGPITVNGVIAGGSGSDTGHVHIDVTPINDSPVGGMISNTTDEDTAVTGYGDIVDVDNDALVYEVGEASNGTVTIDAATGLYTYTPDENFSGTDSFVISATDPGGEGASSTVTITVAPVNDAPVANDITVSGSIDEDSGPLSIFVAHSDVDGDSVGVSAINGQYIDSETPVSVTGGVVTLDDGGDIVFTPNENYNGPVSFQYTLSDGSLSDSGEINLVVAPVNDAPVGAPATNSGFEDTVITGVANITDIDQGDVLTYSVGAASHGTVTIDEETGEYSFTPGQDYHGDATFTVTGTDSDGVSATSDVTITVAPVNDDPVATDYTGTILEDAAPITITVPHTDVDGDTVTVVSVNGQAIDAETSVTVTGGSVTLNEDGDLVFSPGQDFNGAVDFDYALSDGRIRTDFEAAAAAYDTLGAVVSEAGPTGQQIRISAGGSPSDLTDFVGNSSFLASHNMDPNISGYGPILNGGGIKFEIVWDASKSITFEYAIDGQGDADDVWSLVLVDSNGIYRNLLSNRMSEANGVQYLDTSNFSWNNGANDGETYTLAIVVANRSNAASGSFTVDNVRQGGELLTLGNGPAAVGSVHLDVTPVNDSPEGANSTASGDEDHVITGFAAATDVDGDVLTYAIASQAVDGNGDVVGTVTIDPLTGEYSFTPVTNFNGVATFSWSAEDPDGESASGSVTITVAPVNDAPTLDAGGSRTLLEDATITGQATGSDIDGDEITFAQVGSPLAGLTFNANGSWTFNGLDNPAAQALNTGQSLTLTFSYVASDGDLTSAPTTVSLVITGANELFVLTEGVDTFVGTAGGDEIHALGGDDVISGGGGDDLIFGDAGDDLLAGAAGNDDLRGGAGDDTLTGGAGDDVLDGGAGDDVLNGGAGTDLVSYASATGPVNANMTTGTVTGGGIGVDSLISIEGVTGSSFDDTLIGNALANVLIGGLGNDVLNGMGGADTMTGGLGNDTYNVDNLGDVVVEAADEGYDTIVASFNYTLAEGVSIEALTASGSAGLTLTGNSAGQTITGGQGADLLYGLGGNDVLSGGVGNDLLDGGAGADSMTGGVGNDIYVVDDAGDTTIEAASQGTDLVQAYVDMTLAANIENLILMGAAALSGTGNALANTITGNSAANTLNGADGNDLLYGMDGNDVLIGGLGVDTLDGGAGIDTMQGGAGNDVYIVDNSSDVVIELAPDGVDTVQASATFILGANLENLTLTGATSSNGTGNELTNVIYGNAGANTLWGMAGGDQIHGGDGNDVIYGGLGNDQMWGDAGADHFVIENSSIILSGVRETDTLKDFSLSQGDRIDLSGIDANGNAADGDQAFTFVTAFGHHAGEATLTYSAALDTTQLRLDVNGDGAYDYQLNINGNLTTGVPILTGASAPTDGGWLL